jgi:hypothetical protein
MKAYFFMVRIISRHHKKILAVTINCFSTSVWHDIWNNKVRNLQTAELFSFTTMGNITIQKAAAMEDLHDMFQLPLSTEEFQ